MTGCKCKLVLLRSGNLNVLNVMQDCPLTAPTSINRNAFDSNRINLKYEKKCYETLLTFEGIFCKFTLVNRYDDSSHFCWDPSGKTTCVYSALRVHWSVGKIPQWKF